LLALPSFVQAQPSAQYAPGTEGLKAATLPPPGLYLRDYNEFYYADHANDFQGNKVPSPEAFGYVNAPRLIWITDVEVLGGYLGADALVPLNYTHLSGLGQNFGVGDVFFEGTWSSHLKQWDFALGAGAWAPTGRFSPTDPTLPGTGYWTEMFTVGATWYPDEAKKWSLSALNRYECSQQNGDTGNTVGQAYTVEGGLGYGVTKTVDVGVITYYQQQVTPTTGYSFDQRNRVAGVGPEVSAFFPSITLGVSLRYAYEFMAEGRLQGNTVTLTLTKVL
jgi:hypothetical protein